jgi:hypothetical protein
MQIKNKSININININMNINTNTKHQAARSTGLILAPLAIPTHSHPTRTKENREL